MSTRAVAAVVIVLLGAVIVGLGLLGRYNGGQTGPSPSATPRTSLASPSASLPGTAPASPTGSPAAAYLPPRGLVPNAIAEVMIDGLRVRSAPTVDPSSRKLEPLLKRGDELFIVAGPVRADGYDWYQVDEAMSLDLFGWVAAASREGETWIADREPTKCPLLPADTWRLGIFADDVLLHCFGPTMLSFPRYPNSPNPGGAAQGCTKREWPVQYGGAGTYEPSWLIGERSCWFLTGDTCGGCELPIAAAPDSGIRLEDRTEGEWRVRGHFDDPEAQRCRAVAAPDPGPDPAEIILHCRTIFVLTEMEPIT